MYTAARNKFPDAATGQPGTVDISNCDKEPIHIPGLIQAHGVLLCLSEPDLRIVQVSANAGEVVGIPPQILLNQHVDILLGPEQTAELKKIITPGIFPCVLPVRTFDLSQTSFFNAILHRTDGLLVLELEPTASDQKIIEFLRLNAIFTALQEANSLMDFCALAAQEIRNLTGFDRVMVYRFAPNYDGQVIAEAKGDDLPPYLDLHYPASDIPPQARELYLQNWIRIIPNVAYKPSPLVPQQNPLTERPLDMRFAVLRSVSPLHVEYLQNMGVRASMSISIIVAGKLWGLFACHHQSPHFVPYEVRTVCEFLGRTFSMLLVEKEKMEDTAYALRIKSAQARLLENLSRSDNLLTGLHQSGVTVMDLIDAGGAAVCLDNEVVLLGNTPTREQVRAIMGWLQKDVSEDVFSTHSLATRYPEAGLYGDTASGLLAISISKVQSDYILWFRPEVVRTVKWAGNPAKAVVATEDGHRLSPRKSFEAWVEQVKSTALPWTLPEINAAGELRNAIIDIVLKISGELKLRADILGRLNAELERSNDELDSFAYIAAHDLKEPLRGIHNYAGFLLEDYADSLDEGGVSKLKTLVRLSQRMEDLIDSLMHFSRVGRLELDLRPTDLNAVLSEVVYALQVRIEQTGVQIRVPQPLPTVACDPIRTEEVFSNLITNAIKYNDKPEKWVEIGFQTVTSPTPPGDTPASIPATPAYVFYVRDNGIGIEAKHRENVFKIFKRLHTRDKFGGGTGAGLTIVKKIVERHNGTIWIDSVVGEGTTFFFTLKPT